MQRSTLLVVWFIAIGCAEGTPPVDLEAERAAVRRADSLYSAAATAKDVDALTALYASDATIYPPGASSVTGSESIRQFATEFTLAPGLTMTVHSPMIDVAESADIAYTMSIVDLSMTGPDGNPMSDRLRDMHVWKKQADGSWKVVVDIWNSDLAAAAPTPAR